MFLHLLKVSGAAALTGEAIAGHHSQGRYYLTKSKKEVEFYARQAQALLEQAEPLMEIYRSDRAHELSAFLLADSTKPGRRRRILSTLPLHTMEPETLTIHGRHDPCIVPRAVPVVEAAVAFGLMDLLIQG